MHQRAGVTRFFTFHFEVELNPLSPWQYQTKQIAFHFDFFKFLISKGSPKCLSICGVILIR